MGFPNPIVVAEGADPPSDGQVAAWDEASGTFQFATPGAGGFPTDIGTLDFYVQLMPSDSTLVQVVTAPNPAQGPAGLSAHAPDYASATYGPVTLAAGGGIQIQAGTLRFQESPWDGVDAVGSVTVSNLAGTELLVAYVSGFFASGGISPVALTLSEGGSIGSDLAVVGNTITSTAGGLFLVTLNAQAEWD